ncbi:MAG: SocA family protein [Ignisphaera sp.]|nr:SocA family protein [Ignisphaera sp.]
MLRELILYLITRHYIAIGRGIGRAKLMKLAFLVDYLYWKRFGKRLLNVKWVKLLFGAFSKEVLDAVEELEREGIVGVVEVDKGITLYTALYNNVRLGEDAKKIVEEVVKKFGKLSLEELLNYVYNLEEVRARDVGEEIL